MPRRKYETIETSPPIPSDYVTTKRINQLMINGIPFMLTIRTKSIPESERSIERQYYFCHFHFYFLCKIDAQYGSEV
ncbi:hypothetical protein LSTR_LSTR001104 [Laodelphax striatellus]|uniref:Uncharacterized protein n=1 Tax=Laodelphax striatellus TaxID=195883 RepID=A0A482X1F9_LAOST|nr:hypothetical protein LSTR_LSTR001104 [Laodelphax striatellus]